MNGWMSIFSPREATNHALGFRQPRNTSKGNPSSVPNSAPLPPWCYSPGCGPATRQLPFGLSSVFKGISAWIHRKLEDNFLLFVIRFDEAVEAAKIAAAKNTPASKQSWLEKVDAACRFAQVAGMDEANLALLRKDLLGDFTRFTKYPGIPLEDHRSRLDWSRLALHYGMKLQSEYFRKTVGNGP